MLIPLEFFPSSLITLKKKLGRVGVEIKNRLEATSTYVRSYCLSPWEPHHGGEHTPAQKKEKIKEKLGREVVAGLRTISYQGGEPGDKQPRG